jgi:hypothetical protein
MTRVNMDYDGQSDHYRITNSSLVGNVFLRGPSYERLTKPILLRTEGTASSAMDAASYVYDNYAPESGSSLTSLITYNGGHVISGMVSTSTAPVWNTGLTAQKTASNTVYNRVLTYSGARPTDRDSVDNRIVKSVKERSGGIINCVSEQWHRALLARLCGRLAVDCAAHAQAHAAVEPQHCRVEWLHQPRKLAAHHGLCAAGRHLLIEPVIAGIGDGAMMSL